MSLCLAYNEIRASEHFMEKINRSTIAYLFSCIVIYILTLTFFLYTEKQTIYDMLSNQLYYDNILLVYDGKNVDWNKIEENIQYRVYVEVGSNCRVLIKDTSRCSPPMLSGSYPIRQEGMLAVIGKNREYLSKKDCDGNTWIEIGNQQFKISGVMGAEYSTSCDDLIILFGAQLSEEELKNAVYIVDTRSQIGAKIIHRYLTTTYPELQIQQGELKGTARLTMNSYFFKILLVEIIFSIFFLLHISSRFKHEKYSNNYKIYHILGLPSLAILGIEEIETIFLNFISLIVISTLSFGLGMLSRKYLIMIVFIFVGITMLSGIFNFELYMQERRMIENNNRKW